MKEKKYRASITALAFVIILNVVLFSVSMVFAAPSTVVVGDAKSKIHEAVRAKYIAAAFKDCFNHENIVTHDKQLVGIISNPTDYITLTSISKNKGNLFRSARGDNFHNASVGAELKKEISGKASGGKDAGVIECQDNGPSNITKAFMSQFGIQDYASLICDKDSKQNGLLMPKKNGNIDSCEEGTLDALGQFSKNPNGEEYIKKIYNKWAKNNPFAVPYDKLDSYYDDSTLAYDDALTTFELNCSPGADYADNIDTSTYNFKIKLLDSNGKPVEKYPKMIATTEKDGSKKSTNFMSANKKTLKCNELADVINKSFDQYAKNLNVAESDTCNSQEVIDKASEIVRAYGAKNDARVPLTEEEKEEYRILSEALQKKDFTVDDGEGGKKCLETSNLKISVEDTVSDNDSANDAKQSYCQENGGFLSWMLCPTIADGAATASGLLGSITDLTTTHKSIIKQFSDQGSAIYKAWSSFRNLANIGFVIMLLVVVFSQVTNLGISNYNIKKILPKLIITAVLVNFSYLILGVAIDLSHIIGNGIGSAIRTIAGESMSAEASAQASSIVSKIAGMVTGAGLIGGGVAIATTGPALILPVVLFVITTVISVFFGFIMLTIRQAAIIMVIVLAPLAMVLYALPNTAAVTKKYISTLKALLMLYPMFVLATSAGALASTIIVGTSTDMLMLIVGGLLNVLPYFAIPSMTSKSLAGLGAITSGFDKIRGGALKGVGMAGGAIAASEFYKHVKSNYAADQSVARAKRDLRRFDKIKANGGELSIAQMRRQAAAAGVVNSDSKLRAGSNSAGRGALSNMSGLGFENLKATAEKEFREGEVKNIMNKLASDGVDEGTMKSDLISALKTGANYEHMTEDERHANDIQIEALTRSLGATKAGRKEVSNIGKDTGLTTSNRAFTQLASAAVTLPGFADKQQIANNQYTSFLQNTDYDKNDNAKNSSLISATRSAGLDKAYDDMTMDNFLKVGNDDAVEILAKKGANSLDSVVSQTASAALNDANLIANFDKTKMSLVSAEMDNQRTSTINLRSGGTAQVFNPPSDFGEYSQIKNHAGEIIYTNKRGDSFNASTGQITKGV
ncbi:hypothetical protein HG462_000350 [Candidatus Saccharibacteria bacterium]|nr:hypothetical protein [Candidatus Saccharibacteria bacterium]